MQDLLRKYLSSGHTYISLSGIGTIAAEQLHARIDLPNDLLHPPGFIFVYSAEQKEKEPFIHWLMQELQVDTNTADGQFHTFINTLKDELDKNGFVTLNGIGNLRRNEEGQLLFVPDENSYNYLTPVHTEKIIRQGAEHTIRVGENEKTNTEMQELLFGEERKPFYRWWMGALLLLLLAVITLWVYAYTHMPGWSLQGNNQKLKIKEMPLLHQNK